MFVLNFSYLPAENDVLIDRVNRRFVQVILADIVIEQESTRAINSKKGTFHGETIDSLVEGMENLTPEFSSEGDYLRRNAQITNEGFLRIDMRHQRRKQEVSTRDLCMRLVFEVVDFLPFLRRFVPKNFLLDTSSKLTAVNLNDGKAVVYYASRYDIAALETPQPARYALEPDQWRHVEIPRRIYHERTKEIQVTGEIIKR